MMDGGVVQSGNDRFGHIHLGGIGAMWQICSKVTKFGANLRQICSKVAKFGGKFAANLQQGRIKKRSVSTTDQSF
jgi:hypothetical protein